MSERDATNMEWIGAINEIRERLARFIEESSDRVQTDNDKQYIREQGETVEQLLASFAKRFDGAS